MMNTADTTQRRGPRGGFSLIELLVVTLVIVLLLAILLPALAGARESGRRAVCASNLHQYAVSIMSYADDFKQKTPPQFPLTGFSTNMFASNNSGAGIVGSPYETPTSVLGAGWWDLRVILSGYLSSFGVLGCPSLNTTPIDDRANTRAACYYAYDMYAGRGVVPDGPRPPGRLPDRWPDFGLKDGVPDRIDRIENASRMPLTQDRIYYDANTQSFQYTHGTGDKRQNAGAGRPTPTDTTNPSYAYLSSTYPATVAGSNIGFYDGHVRWHALREMDVVGGWHAPPNGQNVYTLSKLPSSTVSPITRGVIVPGAISH